MYYLLQDPLSMEGWVGTVSYIQLFYHNYIRDYIIHLFSNW